MSQISRISIHGGHSGQFCHHATDRLEDIINQYISLGFSWVGITEHCPALSFAVMYPDEQELLLTTEQMLATFTAYIDEARRLQEIYRDKIAVLVAMETETYTGYQRFIPELIDRFRPDYIVGSLHHVNDLGFDYSQEQYHQTANKLGGLDEMYCRYFDQQLEMLHALNPQVVGHFDLIRLFDNDYPPRLRKPSIWQRIIRNLDYIQQTGAILDLNLRALKKGATEPYISAPILKEAIARDITILPGDDSHGVSSVGNYFKQAVETIRAAGGNTDWRIIPSALQAGLQRRT